MITTNDDVAKSARPEKDAPRRGGHELISRAFQAKTRNEVSDDLLDELELETIQALATASMVMKLQERIGVVSGVDDLRSILLRSIERLEQVDNFGLDVPLYRRAEWLREFWQSVDK